MPKYDNSDRLKTVGDKDWCEALDELTTYHKNDYDVETVKEAILSTKCFEPIQLH